jgi:hypothetical protein
MSAFLREYLYLVVKYKFNPVVKHISTKDNYIADYLSRNFSNDEATKFFSSLNMPNMKQLRVADQMFTFTSRW